VKAAWCPSQVRNHRLRANVGLADITKRESRKRQKRNRGSGVTLKTNTKGHIQREVDIYKRLVGIAGLPLLFGWCLFIPPFSYTSMKPFTSNVPEIGLRGSENCCECQHIVMYSGSVESRPPHSCPSFLLSRSRLSITISSRKT
jgi:hypothetical protein